MTFSRMSAVGAAARAVYVTAAFGDGGTPVSRNEAVRLGLAAVEEASPHLRAEFAADMSDALAEHHPEVASILDQLSADYRAELT